MNELVALAAISLCCVFATGLEAVARACGLHCWSALCYDYELPTEAY